MESQTHETPPIPNLASRIPADEELDGDAILDLYLDWTLDLGLELYAAQEDAVLELMASKHLVLATPTGSGKSLVAVAMHLRGLVRGERSVYTAPIKALVSEKFFELCRVFGADNVGMLTGDAAINADAPIVCCTAEVLANMALREGRALPFRHVVMDEFHYYGDPDRGMAWQIPLLIMTGATFLLMSATLGDTSEIEERLAERTGREVGVVSSVERPVPLSFEYSSKPIHEAISDLVRAGRAPIYLVNFSQREAAEQAQSLMSVEVIGKEQKKELARALKGFRFDSPYGQTVERYLRHGVGVHHAGLLPKYRLLTEKLAQQGLLKVVSGTDTLGVGVNVPIRTVLFTKLCKFDGTKTRILSVREFQQIAGRAGRKGFDDEGWVMAQAPEHVIENQRLAAKAATSNKKKVVKKQPPKRGYVPWNSKTFERLVASKCEPLTPVFRVDHGMIVHLLQRNQDRPLQGGGYRALKELIDDVHGTPGFHKKLRRDAAGLFRSLRSLGIAELVPAASGHGKTIEVDANLQVDFSLHHALSLYLVEMTRRLDPDEEDHSVDILTLVEAILEHPRPVLAAQIHRAKGELVAELKAEGVPYEERMEQLDQVTYPKPKGEWIYQTFDDFAEDHPWVGHEAIRPKSVARDMYQRYLAFNDYVREYGLDRMEGVLLRYLTQAYKGLLQIVPDYAKTDDVRDVEAYLRATLARVDSSLLTEWEQLLEVPPDLQGQLEVEARGRPRQLDLLRDPRAFTARIRAELHRLVKALADGDYGEAVHCVLQDPEDPWEPDRFEAALAGYHETYDRILFDHRARLADKTVMTSIGHHVWTATQVLCDPEEEQMWSVDVRIDLSDVQQVGDEPLIVVEKIGI